MNRQRKVSFRSREVGEFLTCLESQVTAGREIALRVVSDAVMRRYNRHYRHSDAPTDVLSFPASLDLLISAETARRQARRLGHSVETEIKILALHGALHLAGHDHERDHGKMARLERRWRRRFALPQGLIQRAKSAIRNPQSAIR